MLHHILRLQRLNILCCLISMISALKNAIERYTNKLFGKEISRETSNRSKKTARSQKVLTRGMIRACAIVLNARVGSAHGKMWYKFMVEIAKSVVGLAVGAIFSFVVFFVIVFLNTDPLILLVGWSGNATTDKSMNVDYPHLGYFILIIGSILVPIIIAFLLRKKFPTFAASFGIGAFLAMGLFHLFAGVL